MSRWLFPIAALLGACSGTPSDDDDAATDTTPVSIDTGDMLYAAFLGDATVGTGWRGTETLAFFKIEGETIGADLCLFTQDATDWASAFPDEPDPFADALGACEECIFAFTVVLENALETSVRGNCTALLGADAAPADAVHAYGYVEGDQLPNGQQVNSIWYWFEAEETWSGAGPATVTGDHMIYEWPIGYFIW